MLPGDGKKSDRKAMVIYISIVVIVMLLINAFLLPAIFRRNIREVDYSTFLNMISEKKISTAEIKRRRFPRPRSTTITYISRTPVNLPAITGQLLSMIPIWSTVCRAPAASSEPL